MQLGFIGAGQMARALASGFVQQGHLTAEQVVASDLMPEAGQAFQSAVPGARFVTANRIVAEQCDVVFLAIKPQHVPRVLAELTPVEQRCLVVSIVAGVPLGRLTSGLGTERVIRVMPNTPCLVGAGAAGYSRAAAVSDEDTQRVANLLTAVGKCWELPESLLDVVTGLSGSGPAYVFQFIEALSDGGVSMGLPRQIATQLAAQTLFGAAQLVLQSGEHPAVLKDQVASPGGTTIAGLHALEQGALRATVMNAVQQATRRAQELGRAEG